MPLRRGGGIGGIAVGVAVGGASVSGGFGVGVARGVAAEGEPATAGEAAPVGERQARSAFAVAVAPRVTSSVGEAEGAGCSPPPVHAAPATMMSAATTARRVLLIAPPSHPDRASRSVQQNRGHLIARAHGVRFLGHNHEGVG